MARFGSSKQTYNNHEIFAWRASCAAHRALLAVNGIVGYPESTIHVVTIIVNQLHGSRALVSATIGYKWRIAGLGCHGRHNFGAYFLNISNFRLKLDDFVEMRPRTLELKSVGCFSKTVPEKMHGEYNCTMTTKTAPFAYVRGSQSDTERSSRSPESLRLQNFIAGHRVSCMEQRPSWFGSVIVFAPDNRWKLYFWDLQKKYGSNYLILRWEIHNLHLFSICVGKALSYGKIAAECRKEAIPADACSTKQLVTPVIVRAALEQAESNFDPDAVLLRGRNDSWWVGDSWWEWPEMPESLFVLERMGGLTVMTVTPQRCSSERTACRSRFKSKSCALNSSDEGTSMFTTQCGITPASHMIFNWTIERGKFSRIQPHCFCSLERRDATTQWVTSFILSSATLENEECIVLGLEPPGVSGSA